VAAIRTIALVGDLAQRSRFMPAHGLERIMDDHVYKVVELVGSSETGIEDAIQTAIRRAGQTLRNIRWFEVVQTRGHVENGEVRHYQVVLKAGFTLDSDSE
jgi:flavin-binding protein dodecin